MGTQKRERQKANKAQRQIAEERAARTGAIKRTVIRWVLIAVLALAGVVVIAWIGGAFDGEETADTVAPAATPTTTIDYETPDKPEVAIPDSIPTELQVTTLIEGAGPEAAAGDTVVVHYVGVLSSDGTEFDNSYDRGSPFPVVLGQGRVIQGWDQGLIGVQTGQRVQLDIPAELAYGDRGSGAIIQPGDALTFVVDVLDVIAAS